jgi:hypothetical protein
MACANYNLDMAATQLGACTCGYAKEDHANAGERIPGMRACAAYCQCLDINAMKFGDCKTCGLPKRDHTLTVSPRSARHFLGRFVNSVSPGSETTARVSTYSGELGDSICSCWGESLV